VLERDRCQCEHVEVKGKDGFYEVPKKAGTGVEEDLPSGPMAGRTA